MIDYAAKIRALRASSDSTVENAARILSAIYFDDERRPPELSSIDELVSAHFPTPFAKSFRSWRDVEHDYTRDLPIDDEQLDSLAEGLAASTRIRCYSAFATMFSCWKQIVHFMPFLLMQSIARIPIDTVREHASEPFSSAVSYYKAFYERYKDDKHNMKKEADQRQLLGHLVKVCRALDLQGALRPYFFFSPVLQAKARFEDFLPERIEAQLWMIQEIRNDVIHGDLGSRTLSVLNQFYPLVAWSFVDVVRLLLPLCEQYALTYIDSFTTMQDSLEASALQFVGESGPATVAYLVDSAEQDDRKRFEYLRLYCIRRGTEVHGSRHAQLSHSDYLDMMPLLLSNLPKRNASAPSSLYGLQEHSQGKYFKFLELSRLEEITVPEKLTVGDVMPPAGDERTAFELLELQYEANRLFRDALGRARAAKSKSSTSDPTLLSAREALWEYVSRDQLGGILDVSRYGSFGEVVEEAAAEHESLAYDPRLFIETPQGSDVRAFLTSNKRAMLLVGRSGFGKSNLLVYFFLQHLKASRFAVFLAGRQLASADIREAVETKVAQAIDYGWGLKNLLRFLDRNQTDLTIFIDGVNEFSGTGGPVALLENLVKVAASEAALGRCRIIATCRVEPWAQYRIDHARPLDHQRFYATTTGEPVPVSGFEDVDIRASAYEKYAAYYALEPASYSALGPLVQDLFSTPLMLSLVAVTYSNRDRSTDEGLRTIPRQLDYFRVFELLTARKGVDAEKLIPARDELRRATITGDLRAFLRLFATKIFERAADHRAPSLDAGHIDALPLDAVSKDQRMDRYVRHVAGETFTVLEIARQLGLVDLVELSEPGGQLHQTGRAYKLFHDQYTQYWLAAFYSEGEQLGSIAGATKGGSTKLDELADKIRSIIVLSRNAPILAGGLEHWFHANLRQAKGNVSALLPTMNRLASGDSGAVRYYATSILSAFVVQRAIQPKELYDAAFSIGSTELRIGLAEAFVDFWPGLSGDATRALLNACSDDEDDLAIETLADVFAEHVNSGSRGADSAPVIEFVGGVFPDLTGFLSLRGLDKLKSHAMFLLRFSQMVIVTCSDRPRILAGLRDMVRRRFHVLIDIILGRPTGSVLDIIPGKQTFFRKVFEWTIYGYWEDAIACGGVNNTFFVEDRELVQREILLQYLPYMCAVNNDDYTQLSLAPGSLFRTMSLSMLNYRQYSIIGFAAYAVVTMALQEGDAVEDFVLELTHNGSPAGRFVAVNIIENYTLVHPSFAPKALAIVADGVLPHLLDDHESLPHLVVCAAGIAEVEIESNWALFKPTLDRSFAYLSKRGNVAEMDAFARELRCLTFFTDIRVGTAFVDYLLRAGYLGDDSIWRPGTLQICAGLHARRRKELEKLFELHGISESTLGECEALKTDEMRDQQRTFGARARWNIFFMRAFAFDKKLRYHLIKSMLGPFALCNDVSEWATLMGTFLIETGRAYIYDDNVPEDYGHLTVADIYASTPFRPRPGGGKAYTPRRRKSAKAT